MREEEKKSAPGGASPRSLIPIEVPEDFEGMRDKLEEWVKYRRGAKLKPWAPATWEKTFKAWRSRYRALAEAIDHSIANGYQGVIEPKSGGGRGPITPPGRISTGDVF